MGDDGAAEGPAARPRFRDLPLEQGTTVQARLTQQAQVSRYTFLATMAGHGLFALGFGLGDYATEARFDSIVARGWAEPLDMSVPSNRALLLEAGRLTVHRETSRHRALMSASTAALAMVAVLPGWIALESELSRLRRKDEVTGADVADLRRRMTRTARAQIVMGAIGCLLGGGATLGLLGTGYDAIPASGLLFATGQLSVGVTSLVIRRATVAGQVPRGVVLAVPTLGGGAFVVRDGPWTR